MEKEIIMPTAEQIRAAYIKIVGYTALEAMLKELYPDVLKPQDNRPVTERIKTFDDALRELGEEHDAVKAYRALMGESVYDDAKDILAYLKLRVITAALNDGWQPQFTEDETRWYVWYGILLRDNIEDLDDEDKSRVVGRSHNGAARVVVSFLRARAARPRLRARVAALGSPSKRERWRSTQASSLPSCTAIIC